VNDQQARGKSRLMSEPTILVPGFYDGAHRLGLLTRWMARAGLHPHPVSPQPSNGTVPLEVLARQLARYINATFPPDQPINLFGFSMGGLICRTYVQRMGGAARTRRLVTLATPHRGTYMAYPFRNRPACVQMRPGSAFLTELNRDLSALEQTRFTSIWTRLDLTIFPAVNCLLPVGEMIHVASPLHGALPFDPRIGRTLVACLQKPIPTRQ
jgi:triacylglycerol lipase